MSGVTYDYDDDRRDQEQKECVIKDSELCYWLRDNGCLPCPVYRMKDPADREMALRNWRVMLSNLPEDIDELGNSDTCVLCKGEAKKATCYASVDMAHPDPPAKKGVIMGFGKKVRIPVGSMFTVNMAVCKDCKKAYNKIDLSFLLWFVGMIAGGILSVCIPAIANPIAQAGGMPLAILLLVGFAVGGYFIGRGVSKYAKKKASKKCKIDLSEVPQIKKMLQNGWFFFQDEKNADNAKMFFSKKKQFKNVFPPEKTGVDSQIVE